MSTMTFARNARIARLAMDQFDNIEGLNIDELRDTAVDLFDDRVGLNLEWIPEHGEILGDVDASAEFAERSAADDDFDPETWLIELAEACINDAIAELCE